MEKALILETAKQMLDLINEKELETIQVSTTTYDDGSKGVTIEVSYPATSTEK